MTTIIRKGTCRFCERDIVLTEEDEEWIDPEAPATPEEGDDFIWRSTCDQNESFTAEHAPIDPSDPEPDEDPYAEDRDRERHL